MEGLAITVAPLFVFKPALGNQEYVAAPLAVIVVEPPKQILEEAGEIIRKGRGFTVIVTDEENLPTCKE